MYELEGSGAQWSNLAKSPIADDSFNLLIIIVMLLCDSLLYFILAWYIEGVFPGRLNYLVECLFCNDLIKLGRLLGNVAQKLKKVVI
jgi:hypothetical protein